MGNPMRVYLEKAVLSQGNDNKLFIVLDNKERVDKYNDEPGKSELSAVIDEAIGKHVEFEMRFADRDKPMAEQYVSLNNIHFDIVTEEEVEMPEFPEDSLGGINSASAELPNEGEPQYEGEAPIETAPGQEGEAPTEAAPMDEQSDIENSGGDIITGIDEDDYYDQQAMDYVEPDYDQQASDDENAFEEKDTEDD